MAKFYFVLASVFALTAVALGAFAAHGLKAHLSTSLLTTFQTGVHYQFLHALALLFVALLLKQQPHRYLKWVAATFVFGVIFFSGSLYALALSQNPIFGPITPLGGLSFILGWCGLIFYGVKEF